VRWENKVSFDCLLSRQHSCQKLLQSNGVCEDHSKSKVGLFLRHSAHRVTEKTGPFVISSYLCFGSYELHENFKKYIGGVACCEYGINVCDSLTILC